MFSSLESNWMESFCRGACLLEYQINTNVYQCCADILHLNFFLDKLEMQEFVRYSVQHAIFIIAMTREEKKWWRLSDEKLCWWYLLKINYLVKTSGYYNDIGWKTKRWGGSYTPNASTNWFAKPRWVESFWLTAWYFVRSSFFLSSRNFDKVKKKVHILAKLTLKCGLTMMQGELCWKRVAAIEDQRWSKDDLARLHGECSMKKI